ncbi:MAG: hypothetical protein GX767_02755 [Firmicutes bacterium]|nr:hypothetical protein [Bacillota bacterium]
MSFRENGHIATTVRLMERLKIELLSAVSRLHRSLFHGAEKKALESLGQLMIVCYLLGKKLGFTYYRLDCLLQQQARQLIRQEEEELLREEMLELLQYLESREK